MPSTSALMRGEPYKMSYGEAQELSPPEALKEVHDSSPRLQIAIRL